MSKRFTKIICVIVAVIVAASIWLLAGCSNLYGGNQLSGDISGTVESNGGFVVKKGGYIYFINGSESYTADNTYGTPVKGSVMRISVSDFDNRNYSNVETVVPLVVYSGNSNAGIFIYGDYIYYATPSTDKNSDGEVQNSRLEFKRSKLDGTETMKDYYLQLTSNSTEYRYVQADNGKVYLVYVATSETYYDESTGVTNLHSLNLETGANTVLAYNVDSVMFDGNDLTNPRMYYTMSVKDYSSDSTCSYNQVYTVTADETEANEYDFSNVTGWVSQDDVDEGEDYDIYINCGDLVFDGIGTFDTETVFNYYENGAVVRNLTSYTYTLSAYTHGRLFYTRTTTNNSGANLFILSESELLTGGEVKSWNPVAANPSRELRTLTDGSSASNYTYLFDDNDNFEGVIISESGGGITVNYAYEENDAVKLNTEIRANTESKYFYILTEGSATVLFTEGNYLYYSLSGGNGYTVYRIDYTGGHDDYDGMPAEDDVDDYNSVRILDLDALNGWYFPEIIDDQLIFAGNTDDMSSYNYIMVCDLRNGNGELMNNTEIDALNEKFEGISDKIDEYSDTDDYPEERYANLTNALKFAYITGDADYIKELAVLCNEAAWEDDEDADPVYSDYTLEKYADFLAAEGDWSDYNADSRKINGETVYSNSRDYYYTLLGVMSEDDAETYFDALKATYLQSEPEDDTTWWGGLSTAAKVWFVIGVTVGALVVIGGITVLIIFLVKRGNRKGGGQRRRRIKVDTTDDKDIDVYKTDGEDSGETQE